MRSFFFSPQKAVANEIFLLKNRSNKYALGLLTLMTAWEWILPLNECGFLKKKNEMAGFKNRPF